MPLAGPKQDVPYKGCKNMQKAQKRGLVFVGLGLEAVLLVIGAVFLGQKIDQVMGWQGGATVTLLIMSLAAWFVHLFRLIGQFMPPKNRGAK